jgi:hypothetical protein
MFLGLSFISPAIRLPESEFLIGLTLPSVAASFGLFCVPTAVFRPKKKPRRRHPSGGCWFERYCCGWRILHYRHFLGFGFCNTGLNGDCISGYLHFMKARY